jgi:hypothetical protein
LNITSRKCLHGQWRVSLVVVHTFLLVEALGLKELAAPTWAAAYVHDLGRRHDGRCRDHGRYALDRLPTMPGVTSVLERGGVMVQHWEGISVAVENHCRSEIPKDHPHWTLTAILKDADGLDRVRLGALNPEFLRLPLSRALMPFAEALYEETHAAVRPGPDYFAALWPIAERLLAASRQ